VYGQIEQEIRKRDGETIKERIDRIDSLRFVVERSEMEIMKKEGGIEVHKLGDILEVGFKNFADFSYPPGTVHCDPDNLTAVVEVINPVTGKIWMDRNLGASRVAQVFDDPASYGDLYQWGRLADGHQCRNSSTTDQLSSFDLPLLGDFILAPNFPFDWRSPQNDNLWQGLNGMNNPCPIGYRLPTELELNAERLSWTENNKMGAFNSPLKWPSSGARSSSNGSLSLVGTDGVYWASTASDIFSRFLYFVSNNATMSSFSRADGFSVRCFKEVLEGQIGALDCLGAQILGEVVEGIEVNEVAIIVNYTDGNGSSYQSQSLLSKEVLDLTASLPAGQFNVGSGSVVLTITGTAQSLGLAVFALELGGQSCSIEVEVMEGAETSYPPGTVHCDPDNPTAVVDVLNPATGKTWMDRNLGASQVARFVNDPLSYGDLYQWGRLADGHQCRNSASTEELSSSDEPEHGDFILTPDSPFDWRIPQVDNLWQGLEGVNNPCPRGYRLPTESELNEELLSWNSSNREGAFASPLKIPSSGLRLYTNVSLNIVGTNGGYWSSTVSNRDSRRLFFTIGIASVSTDGRALGCSVRCLKD